MNVSGGVIKLERLVSSKRALQKKLETHSDDSGIIKETIKKLEKDIAYIKKEINFNERFEVGKICTCPVADIVEYRDGTVEEIPAIDAEKLVCHPEVELVIAGKEVKKEELVKKFSENQAKMEQDKIIKPKRKTKRKKK